MKPTKRPDPGNKLVSLEFLRLVERLALRLDMDRALRPRQLRRRSREEAISEAVSRWQFRYDDLTDDEASW